MRRRQGTRAQQTTWNYLTRELKRDAKQHEEYLQTPRGFFRLWLCPDTLGDDRPAREELQRLWEESHSVYPSLN